MARYDRIAMLDAPSRDEAFPGWPVLRDLEGRPRDRRLIRRVHLRFLALRPVNRLLRGDRDRATRSSLQIQIEGARDAVAGLARRDIERRCWTDVLESLADEKPDELAAALLAAGRCAERMGHRHGAEEIFRTALEWAERHGPSAATVHAAAGPLVAASAAALIPAAPG